jgi:hypothetical protein
MFRFIVLRLDGTVMDFAMGAASPPPSSNSPATGDDRQEHRRSMVPFVREIDPPPGRANRFACGD